MNIDSLIFGRVYKVTKSKYQFNKGDIVYSPVPDILVVQDNDDELVKVELTSGRTGLAMTGTSGFLELSEMMNKSDCPEDVEGMNLREFLLNIDKTEFEEMSGVGLKSTSHTVTAVPA